jgi:hypothetical protein
LRHVEYSSLVGMVPPEGTPKAESQTEADKLAGPFLDAWPDGNLPKAPELDDPEVCRRVNNLKQYQRRANVELKSCLAAKGFTTAQ